MFCSKKSNTLISATLQTLKFKINVGGAAFWCPCSPGTELSELLSLSCDSEDEVSLLLSTLREFRFLYVNLHILTPRKCPFL